MGRGNPCFVAAGHRPALHSFSQDYLALTPEILKMPAIMRTAKSILVTGFILITTRALAQLPIDGVHYPAGLNGLNAGIPDSPGFNFRDDNWFYVSSGYGPDVNELVYLQAPQLSWLSDWTVLGAHVGADLMVPLIYKSEDYELQLSPKIVLEKTSTSRFGLGDIKIEPLVLAWQWNHLDLMAAGAIWAPTGHYVANEGSNLGNGTWSPMVTLGGVWHPDEKKTWSLSILNHYEMNCRQPAEKIKISSNFPFFKHVFYDAPSSTYTLECAAGKTIFENIDLGVTGYYQQQFSDETTHRAHHNPNQDAYVLGAGPEIATRIPQWNLAMSLRYAYEFTAYNRPQGNMIDLSATVKF